jgi:hypothetical protein
MSCLICFVILPSCSTSDNFQQRRALPLQLLALALPAVVRTTVLPQRLTIALHVGFVEGRVALRQASTPPPPRCLGLCVGYNSTNSPFSFLPVPILCDRPGQPEYHSVGISVTWRFKLNSRENFQMKLQGHRSSFKKTRKGWYRHWVMLTVSPPPPTVAHFRRPLQVAGISEFIIYLTV